MQISASQLETFDGSKESCNRKWAFQSLWFLPQIEGKSSATAVGSVLHAVVERWLLADDLGRDQHGKPVELYPQLWEHPLDYRGNRQAAIDKEDQELIKKLVTMGIEQGVIQRHLGRKIEYEIIHPLPEIDGRLKGYVDLLAPGRIEDHKTTGNMRYAKSAESLKTNTQLIVYGKHVLQEYTKIFGVEAPKSLIFRHNVFLTDPVEPLVKATEVQVAAEEVEAEWLTLVPRMYKMRDLRKKLTGLGPDRWEEVPQAANLSAACRAFGGCPYQVICGRSEKVDEYTRRVNNYNENRNKPVEQVVSVVAAGCAKNPYEGVKTVNLLDILKSKGIQATTHETVAPVGLQVPSTPPAVNPFAAMIGVAPLPPAVNAPVVPPPQTPVIQLDLAPQPVAPVVQVAPVAPVVQVTPVQPAAPVAEPPKKKRGRPSKAELAARAAGTTNVAPPPVVQVMQEVEQDEDEDEEELAEEVLSNATQVTQVAPSSTGFNPFGEAGKVPWGAGAEPAKEAPKSNSPQTAAAVQPKEIPPAPQAAAGNFINAIFGSAITPPVNPPVAPVMQVQEKPAEKTADKPVAIPLPIVTGTSQVPQGLPQTVATVYPSAVIPPSVVSVAPAVPSADGTREIKLNVAYGNTLFWLFENCVPYKLPANTRVVYLSELLLHVGQQMVTSIGRPEITSFYQLNDFERRNNMMRYAEGIVGMFLKPGDIVIQDSEAPDVAALALALRPFAMLGVRAVR